MKEKIIHNWLDNNFGTDQVNTFIQVNIFITTKYPDCFFYKKEGNFVMAKSKDNVICFDSNNIWSFLQGMFSLTDDKIKEVLSNWASKRFEIKNCKVINEDLVSLKHLKTNWVCLSD